MTSYSEADIDKGAGAFDQAMLSQTDLPGRARRMTPGVAIGVLSAAMRGGVPANKFDHMIDRDFPSSAALLKRVLAMYEGDDWDIHLWHLLPTGKYKLCTALCHPDQVGWRYDINARSLED